ncbi:MAG: hypothetical protein ABWY63_12845 [Hyphomicrobiaceae bacterium]|jgi:hypothetical protein
MNSVASWLFNLMFLGAIVTLAVLLYGTQNPGFLASSTNAVVALVSAGVVAVVSAFWPKF